jgi:hypothetical protein
MDDRDSLLATDDGLELPIGGLSAFRSLPVVTFKFGRASTHLTTMLAYQVQSTPVSEYGVPQQHGVIQYNCVLKYGINVLSRYLNAVPV